MIRLAAGFAVLVVTLGAVFVAVTSLIQISPSDPGPIEEDDG